MAPLGKIPVLLTDNGNSGKERAISESDVIAQFLCQSVASKGVFPPCFNLKFAEALATINGAMEAAAAMIMERWKGSGPEIDASVERQRQRLERSVRHLDSLVSVIKNEHGLAGFTNSDEIPNYLVIAVVSLLGYLDFRGQLDSWRSLSPSLLPLFAEFEKRPSFEQSRPNS
jgi:glutathione S-transferase